MKVYELLLFIIGKRRNVLYSRMVIIPVIGDVKKNIYGCGFLFYFEHCYYIVNSTNYDTFTQFMYSMCCVEIYFQYMVRSYFLHTP